jgi:hypothetical protein
MPIIVEHDAYAHPGILRTRKIAAGFVQGLADPHRLAV